MKLPILFDLQRLSGAMTLESRPRQIHGPPRPRNVTWINLCNSFLYFQVSYYTAGTYSNLFRCHYFIHPIWEACAEMGSWVWAVDRNIPPMDGFWRGLLEGRPTIPILPLVGQIKLSSRWSHLRCQVICLPFVM